MSDPAATLRQLLANRLGGDPAAKLQEAVRARLESRPPGDPLRQVLTQMLAPKAAAPSRADEATVLLRAAREALNTLQSRDTTLAAALGACADCWGTNPGCPRCAGLGRPGWTTPDPASFATWVAPAVTAMAAAVRRAADSLPTQTGGTVS
jgi:hypothetical protein